MSAAAAVREQHFCVRANAPDVRHVISLSLRFRVNRRRSASLTALRNQLWMSAVRCVILALRMSPPCEGHPLPNRVYPTCR